MCVRTSIAQKEPTRNNFTDTKAGDYPTSERLNDWEFGYMQIDLKDSAIRRLLFHDLPGNPTSVSYTHLDVYKRQSTDFLTKRSKHGKRICDKRSGWMFPIFPLTTSFTKKVPHFTN